MAFDLHNALKARVDWPIRLRPAIDRTEQCSVFVVYRRRNARHVVALREQAGVVNLCAWALDSVEPSLRDVTIGEGAGNKFELLDRMLQACPRPANEWLVMADDDVTFVRGDISLFVNMASRCGAELAQPGHDRRGFVNYGITVSRPLTRARQTTFVEIGPVFGISPRGRERLVPFGDVGMGYGLERCWYNLRPRPTFVVVDEVRMRHLVPAGTSYDSGALAAEMPTLWTRRGAVEPQPEVNLNVWPAWRRMPPLPQVN